MSNDNRKATDDQDLTRSTPVTDHKSYGGASRDEVAGGPAGRGNDKGATPDPDRGWGRNPGGDGEDLPVDGNNKKNPFGDK